MQDPWIVLEFETEGVKHSLLASMQKTQASKAYFSLSLNTFVFTFYDHNAALSHSIAHRGYAHIYILCHFPTEYLHTLVSESLSHSAYQNMLK